MPILCYPSFQAILVLQIITGSSLTENYPIPDLSLFAHKLSIFDDLIFDHDTRIKSVLFFYICSQQILVGKQDNYEDTVSGCLFLVGGFEKELLWVF